MGMTATLPDPPELDPAALASSEFSRTRRGLEPTEVRAALGRAADAIRTWEERDRQLRSRLEATEAKLVDAQRLDESQVAAVLGEETARIVTAARDAAAEIRSKAEEQAARLIKDADERATAEAQALRAEAQLLHDEATARKERVDAEVAAQREEAAAAADELRRSAEEYDEKVRAEADAHAAATREEAAALATATVSDAQARSDELLSAAESVLAERTAEAEAAAAEIRAAAETERSEAREEAAELRRTAAEDVEALRADADTRAEEIIAAARQHGIEMVEQARAVRERMLNDLAERRRLARRQIEAALAGRDRIVELLSEAHLSVAATIDGLSDIDADAARVADNAASAVEDDLDDEIEALESLPTPEILAAPPVEPVESSEPILDEPASDEPALDEPAPDAPVAESQDTEESAPEEPAAPTAESTEEPSDDPDSGEPEAGAPQTGDADTIDLSADDPAADASGHGDPDGTSDSDDGATVHDLFARIRAASDPDTDGTGTDSDTSTSTGTDSEGTDTDGGVAAAVDLTDGAVAPDHEGDTLIEAAPAEAAEAEPAEVVLTDTLVLDLRDERLAPVEKSLARVLKRLVSDEQNEVLDRLRRVKRGRPDPEEILPGPSAQDYVDALAEEFDAAVAAGAATWSELAGGEVVDLTVTGGHGAHEKGRERLIAKVEEFISLHRAHLERAFTEAEEEGLDTADVSDRLRAAYRDWRSSSLGEFAGDLATAGFTYGQMLGAGEGTPWRWVVDNGGLGCADGEDNALAGAVESCTPFPTGDITPPAHPGCRCILAPAR